MSRFVTAHLSSWKIKLGEDRQEAASFDFFFYIERSLILTQFAYREGGKCVNALLSMQHSILSFLGNPVCKGFDYLVWTSVRLSTR